MTPERDRITLRETPGANPGVSALRSYLSSGKDAEEAFAKWRSLPMTKMFMRALDELADAPPPFSGDRVDTNYVLVQYGMTSGLSLAKKLMTQPYRVYPEIFRGTSPAETVELNESYVDTLDSTIDDM